MPNRTYSQSTLKLVSFHIQAQLNAFIQILDYFSQSVDVDGLNLLVYSVWGLLRQNHPACKISSLWGRGTVHRATQSSVPLSSVHSQHRVPKTVPTCNHLPPQTCPLSRTPFWIVFICATLLKNWQLILTVPDTDSSCCWQCLILTVPHLDSSLYWQCLIPTVLDTDGSGY